MNKREIGNLYETLVTDFLKQHGFNIVTRNFYCRMGEIDIIASKDNTLHFIEVKYRKNNNVGTAYEAIDFRKQKRIYKSAMFYMLKNNIGQNIPCSFDAVLITDTKIDLIENAFGGI